jgi:hypothetical protein
MVEESTGRTFGRKDFLRFVPDRIRAVFADRGDNPAKTDEETPSTTAEPKEKITSRRKFLESSGKITIGILVEAYTGILVDVFVVPLERIYRSLGILENGNPIQFLTVLEDLLRHYATSRTDENKKKLMTWLKFNGTIHYGRKNGQFLAADFMNHFLYGKGKDYDISKLLSKEFKRFLLSLPDKKRQEMGINENLTEQEAIEIVFKAVLSGTHTNLINATYGPFATEKIDGEMTYYSGAPNTELLYKVLSLFAVAYLGDSVNFTQIMNSLGQATFAAVGKVDAVSQSGVTFKSVKLSVYDTYDWSKATDVGAHVRIEELIIELGLQDLFEDEMFDDIKNEVISIIDKDGAYLVENDLGNNFDIFGHLGEVKDFSITPNAFEAPDATYLEEHPGVKVVEL